MLGQIRNSSKRGVASFRDSAPDEELVAATKSGDELAFETLVKRQQRRIFALAFRYTRVREDAEDIVQETFRKAFVHLQKFEGKSSFSTWLARIAINEALMSLRRRRALHEVPADDSSGDHGTTPGPDLAEASPDPEATCLQKEEARILSAAIRHLSPHWPTTKFLNSRRSSLQEKLYLEEEIRSDSGFDRIIGKSAPLKHILQLVETVAPSDSTVLLLGETGTGKELIARAIHDRSRRKDHTFVKLNCAAIPTGLLESELFGHEKGAFTGAITQKTGRLELADQGTLFLDEVGDIPIEIQPKLLRALQEREFERLGSTHTRKVNVRLVAATNRNLEKMVADREFRSDLFYRLNVFPIRIPSLRERKEDIPLLVSYFVQKFAKQMRKEIASVPSAAMKGLTAWEWPGNIRELENFIERAVILTRGKALEVPLTELQKTETETAIDAVVVNKKRAARISFTSGPEINAGAAEYERKQREEIIQTLTACKGRVGGTDGAAIRLGISRTTLIYRMRKLGIYAKLYS